MVIVNGGKYTPSFFNEEREVCNLEVCKYQTTQDMWMEVMKNNPSEFKGGRRPVENVSWWDALEFCNKLSKKYGLKPVYDLSRKEEGILRIHQSNGKIEYPNVVDFRKTEGFRLPTEVEWEWFARGGEIAIQDGTFNYKHSGSDNLNEVAWYYANSENRTHDVGAKRPNQLGLYDCSGNIYEWCYDTGSDGYISEKTPYIYDETEESRVLKGGSWNNLNYKDIEYEIFERYSDKAENSQKYYYVLKASYGFRIVRTI